MTITQTVRMVGLVLGVYWFGLWFLLPWALSGFYVKRNGQYI